MYAYGARSENRLFEVSSPVSHVAGVAKVTANAIRIPNVRMEEVALGLW